jgi:hypothetical protein
MTEKISSLPILGLLGLVIIVLLGGAPGTRKGRGL